MPAAVLDAMVVIGLAKGNVFNHLASVYSPLYVPSRVRQEIIGQGQGRPGVAELTQALGSWVTEVSPKPATLQPFAALRSVADQEVLAATKELGVSYLLSDDKVVRREALALGCTCLSTPQVVDLFKYLGLIPAVRPVLDRMRQQGFGIAQADYQQAVLAAGE